MRAAKLAKLFLAVVLLVPACADEAGDAGDVEDGEDDRADGKADGVVEGSAQAAAILALVNDRTVTRDELDFDAGLSARVSDNIIGHRDGIDHAYGTVDDDHYESIAELDAIPYVGPVTLNTLLTYAGQRGTEDVGNSAPVVVAGVANTRGAVTTQVVMSGGGGLVQVRPLGLGAFDIVQIALDGSVLASTKVESGLNEPNIQVVAGGDGAVAVAFEGFAARVAGETLACPSGGGRCGFVYRLSSDGSVLARRATQPRPRIRFAPSGALLMTNFAMRQGGLAYDAGMTLLDGTTLDLRWTKWIGAYAWSGHYPTAPFISNNRYCFQIGVLPQFLVNWTLQCWTPTGLASADAGPRPVSDPHDKVVTGSLGRATVTATHAASLTPGLSVPYAIPVAARPYYHAVPIDGGRMAVATWEWVMIIGADGEVSWMYPARATSLIESDGRLLAEVWSSGSPTYFPGLATPFAHGVTVTLVIDP